jgi:hypothetical protein
MEDSAARPPLSPLGRGAMIFGVVNLVRLIAERVMVGSGSKGTYTLVLTADILLSALLIVGGRGLLKRSPWAPSAILFSSGALFVSSVVLFLWMWPYFQRAAEQGIRMSSSDILLGPRLLFYAFLVLACPYAAVTLVRRREPAWPSRGRLVGWLVGGAAGGGAFVALLIARH